MSSIKILKPEVINDSSKDHSLTLIRRILFIRQNDKDFCTPRIVDLTSMYPSSLQDGIFQCKTTGIYNSNGFTAIIQINTDMIESIHSGSKDADTIVYEYSGKIITAPLWVDFSSIEPLNNADKPLLARLSESNNIAFRFKGDIELYLKFECCSKSKETTCYQLEHPKTWNLQAKCIYGQVGFTI